MTAIFPYLIKVLLCSAILMGYYYVALRNKLFHQWNRFYLLATLFLSILLPLCSITFFYTRSEQDTTPIHLLYAVGSGDEYVISFTARSSYSTLLLENGPLIGYALISATLMIYLLISLFNIWRLISQHTVEKIDNIHFISTPVKGTPFSFFDYLFWNPSIPLHTPTGQQIFLHECVHIREKHTIDKLLVQIILVLWWWNPLFWILRYEMRMVHEFIADKKAIEQQDSTALAAMILQAAYPHQYNSIINSFFHQSIKRRLYMLNKKHSPRFSYISRLLLIPTFALIILAFNLRMKEGNASANIESKALAANNSKAGNEAAASTNMSFEKSLSGSILDTSIISAKSNSVVDQNEDLAIKALFTIDSETNVHNDSSLEKEKSLTADLLQKNKISASVDTVKPIFIKADKEPEFPGGQVGWRNFLQKHLNASVPVDNEAPPGVYTVLIEFIVDEEGKISDIRSLSKNGYGTEEEVLRAMRFSPDWIPAKQNGRNITFLRKQPVTFVIAE